MHDTSLKELLALAVDGINAWQAHSAPWQPHPSVQVPRSEMERALTTLVERLHDNYPFFHPNYAGQMLKPPHPAAIAGYVAAMLINPNAHALDGGPATSYLEKELVAQLTAMFALPGAAEGSYLGHLTSSGTIANLEALFVARESHPGKAIAHSADAHYTHQRMCHVLGVESISVPTDGAGRLDRQALERVLDEGRVGTVVVTAGTTGLGAVDPLHELIPLIHSKGARVHVDGAYGGFFVLASRSATPVLDAQPWTALGMADSIVVDPHKHGLQPYGCGAVLFSDPRVGRFYHHDSPYTYFTSDELHLGEISLECSRAGAAAAALWMTQAVLPWQPDSGLGGILNSTLRAARLFADEVRSVEHVRLYLEPELDIVTYFPVAATTSAIDQWSDRVLHAGMNAREPIFLSTLSVDSAHFVSHHPDIVVDTPTVRILRSVLMKPEHEYHAPALVQRICDVVQATAAD